jgi:ferric iron reductase protein FhuF
MRAVQATPAELRPIVDVLDRVEERLGEAPVHGLVRGLVAADASEQGDGWRSASRLVDGSAIDSLLDAAEQRWDAEPHVAAALAWKSYAYWATLPAVLGFVAARVVPDMRPDNVEFQIHGRPPFVALRLTRAAATSLAGDDVDWQAVSCGLDPRPSEASATLLAELRKGLLDEHLNPMLEQIRLRVHLGRRTLLGSVASAVCYAVLRATPDLPPRSLRDAHRILEALGLTGLVDFGPGADGALRIQRHTCCLAFALPQPKVCAGCVIPRNRPAVI